MAGKKGRSGNWSQLKKDIMNVNLDLCDVILHEYLLNKDIATEDKVARIIPLLTKRIPQKLDHSGELSHNHFILDAISKSGGVND